MSYRRMTDRGVSEALGFVLVFALVTGTIGMVYATGFSGLQDAQQAEKLNNVERAFDVLADNVEDVHRRGAPSRATEVKLAGGSLRTGEPVTLHIRAEEVGVPNHNATYTVNLEPVVYEDDGGTAVLYANGAVLRSQSGGAVMLSEPGWVIGPNRSVIPIVSTYGDGGSIGGEGAVLIVAQRGTRTLPEPFVVGSGSTATVNVTVTSTRVGAWNRFFDGRGLEPLDNETADGNVTYQFETETLYVPRTEIEVSFNR